MYKLKVISTIVLTILVGFAFFSAQASTLPASHSVRIIDLEELIDSDASKVRGAFVLNQSTCVLVTQTPTNNNMEVVLFDIKDLQVISRASILNVDVLDYQYWCEGTLHLWFRPVFEENNENSDKYVEVIIKQNGQISTSIKRQLIMQMPDGKTGVYSADDWSLVTIDFSSGDMKLLLQGVPDNLSPDRDDNMSYMRYLKYEQHSDDIGYDLRNDNGQLISHPLSENDFLENEMWLWRYFTPFEPVDDHRFVYTVYGWEWGAGYGVYDVTASKNYRITGTGKLLGRRGNLLFGSDIVTDIDSFQSSRYPFAIRELFSEMIDQENRKIDFDISPNGKLLVLMGSKKMNPSTITIYDLKTGNIQYFADISIPPSAIECQVSFINETSVLLLYLTSGNVPPFMCIVTFE